MFATGQFGIPTPDGVDTSTTVKGLFYGGGWNQLKSQAIGSLTCVIVVTSVALLVMYVVKAIRGSWNLRVSRDGELEGLDIHEHGSPAYHMEFGHGVTYTAPPSFGKTFGGSVAAGEASEATPVPVGSDSGQA